MFLCLINFFKKIWEKMSMKTMEKKETISVKTDWETLCDVCAQYAERANWTEEKSENIIRDVRKENRG